jgi:hypothetical protein
MKRRFIRRGWLGALGGWVTATGLALAQGGRSEAPPPPPQVGDVITLRFHDGRDRTVKVLKSQRQPDGSYLSEVRDVKTGEVFNLLDPPPSSLPSHKSASPPSGGSSRGGTAKPSSPLSPPSASAGSADPTSRPNRPLLNLFRSSRLGNDSNTGGTDTDRRPGLFQRLFGGPKKDTPPQAAPSPGLIPAPGTTGLRPQSRLSEKLPVSPTPSTSVPDPGYSKPPSSFPLAMPSRPTPPPFPSASTPEPPRAQPGTSSGTPSPVPLPPIPAPPPLPTPTDPAPVPEVPAVPPITIPIPPAGGVSSQSASTGIAPAAARHTKAQQPVTLLSDLPPPVARDLQPYVHALQHAAAPSARALAARALADSAQGSSPAVQNLLFHACRNDPAPFVRACCIDELARSGYADPAFLAYLRQACEEEDDSVRLAAQLALRKLQAVPSTAR